MTNKQVHTTYDKTNEVWRVKTTGNERASGIFETKSDAVKRGAEIAKNNSAEHVIHNMNGRISDKDSYGNDFCPPKDKKY